MLSHDVLSRAVAFENLIQNDDFHSNFWKLKMIFSKNGNSTRFYSFWISILSDFMRLWIKMSSKFCQKVVSLCLRIALSNLTEGLEIGIKFRNCRSFSWFRNYRSFQRFMKVAEFMNSLSKVNNINNAINRKYFSRH